MKRKLKITIKDDHNHYALIEQVNNRETEINRGIFLDKDQYEQLRQHFLSGSGFSAFRSPKFNNKKMKSTIWKYVLKVTDVQDIEIPHGSILLSVQTQNGDPCLWVLVYDTEAEKEVIRLRTIGTGHNITADDFNPKDFLGTYQLSNGAFVGHVFQVTS